MLCLQHQARSLCGHDLSRLSTNTYQLLRISRFGRGSISLRSNSTCRSTTSSRVSARREGSGSLDSDDSIPQAAKVFLSKKDISLSELLSQVEDAELDLQPHYQRGLVWDTKMASRLVVTALEARVVPAVYLEETKDGIYTIMDGKQRLTSLLTFIKGSKTIGNITWESAPEKLDLKDDSCDPRWQGKRFVDLPPDRQRKLRQYSIMCVIVGAETDRDVVFSIYQDINTGAVGHTDQQNRKAAYHGPYIELLEELANNRHFLEIQGREAPDSEKETDRELILRFFAMLRSANTFKTPMWKFLNAELKQYQKADDAEIYRLREVFKNTADTVWQIWGPDACRLPRTDEPSTSKARKPQELNPSLWDATMVAVAEELASSKQRRSQMTRAGGAIKEAYMQLCSSDDKFKGSLRTSGRKSVLERIELMKNMLRRVAPTRTDQRVFTAAIKQQLWSQSMETSAMCRCGICSQQIHKLADAEVDHVVPYSRGGSTTLDNAQLVHRFCNRNKGNRVEVA